MPQSLSGMAPPQAPQTAVAGVPVPGLGDETQGRAQASPEEQQVYETFVAQGLTLLFDKKNLPKILEGMATRDPRQGVASVTAMIVTRVVDAALKAGQQIPTDVILQGSAEIFENVIDLAQEAGVYDFAKDRQVLNGAMVRAYDEIRLQLQDRGVLDQAEMQAAFQEVQAANADGTLAQKLGITPEDMAPVDPGQRFNLDEEEEPPKMNRQQRRAAERRAAKEARRG